MEKQRLTVTLDYDVWNILRLQAKVKELSLSKHINAILREQVGVADPTIMDAMIRLSEAGTVTYVTSKADFLRSKSHFEREGDSLDGASSGLSTDDSTG